MSTNALDSVSGSDRRIDLYSESHQAHLNPGQRVGVAEISSGGPGQTRDSTQQNLSGWQRTELAFQNAGNNFQSGDRWARYSSGGGRSSGRGSIEIDGTNPQNTQLRPNIQVKQSGIERLEAAYQNAATFEETQRDRRVLLGRSRR